MPQYPESTRDKLQQAKGDGHNRSKRALGLLRSGVEERMEGVVEAREQKQENQNGAETAPGPSCKQAEDDAHIRDKGAQGLLCSGMEEQGHGEGREQKPGRRRVVQHDMLGRQIVVGE